MKLPTEYIIVSDKDSKVIKSFDNYPEANTFYCLLLRADAQVTLFKSLKGKKK